MLGASPPPPSPAAPPTNLGSDDEGEPPTGDDRNEDTGSKADPGRGFPGPLGHPVALVALGSLAYLLWVLRLELVVLFAAVLFGVALYAGGRWLSGLTGIPQRGAVAIVYVLSLLVLSAFLFISSRRLADQYNRLEERIPVALETAEERLSDLPLLSPLARQMRQLREGMSGDGDASGSSPPEGSDGQQDAESGGQEGGDDGGGGMGIVSVVSITMQTLGYIALVLVLAFYIAFDGDRYSKTLLRLFPPERREMGGDLVSALGTALPWWLVGRLSSMAVVALLTTPGLYLLDVPLALVLGLMAGLFSFVPVLGPIAAAIPAVLITLDAVPGNIVWVLALYATVQFLETWLITPRIQDRMASVPPLILLFAQVAMGVLVGIAGVMFSTPLALAVMVIVQVGYMRHALGEDVQPAGGNHGG